MTAEYAQISLDLGPRGWREVWCRMAYEDGKFRFETDRPSQKRWVNIMNGVDEETGLFQTPDGEYHWDINA
ncbi:hypothetical protein [Aureimonas altamirensis]|uniref:hypothetical protein n=1 Tax=Aureimonas altamirensis TaxID=370622 RepID=UPI0025522185|nr:hypothetical protein [Aureimonas altamirensis]